MVDFFRLYIGNIAFENNSLDIILIILYVNVFIYLLDFYNLVKRKSKAETLAVMGVPTVVAVMGSVFAVLFVSVPEPGNLDSFVAVLAEPEVCMHLVFIVGVYAILWLITYFSQKKRARKDIRKWIISCIPDYCFAVGVILGTVCRLIVGINFFTINNQTFLWMYAYCIFFLSCKAILLTVGNLVRLYSLKITIFRWTERKNPASFLARYFYFCQSAILRNVMLFELGLLIPLTVLFYDYGLTYELFFMMLFFYLSAGFVVVVSTAPVRKGLNQFLQWDGAEKSKRLFCQEYFLEEALYKDDNFTVTRHFLIAEQHPADVFYWPYLRNVSGWILGNEGNYRELVFSDGKVYRFTPEEAAESEEIFRYAQRRMEVNSYSFINR